MEGWFGKVGGKRVSCTSLVSASSLHTWVLCGVLLQRVSGLAQNLKALFLAVAGRVEGITARAVAVKWLTSACLGTLGPSALTPTDPLTQPWLMLCLHPPFAS